MRQQHQSEVTNSTWSPNNRLFDLSGSDWSLGLIPTQHHIFGSLAQQ
jgi:hypothetical protein